MASFQTDVAVVEIQLIEAPTRGRRLRSRSIALHLADLAGVLDMIRSIQESIFIDVTDGKKGWQLPLLKVS